MILTREQFDEAIAVGTSRQSLREKRQMSPPQYEDGGGSHYDRHHLGAVAEYALALYFDRLDKWRTTQAYSERPWQIRCDVGENLHVRATSRVNGGLIVHGADPDEGVFILALVNGPVVSFVGWLYGSEAKNPTYWRDSGPGFEKRPAYVVKQRHLRPMETIPKEAV